jgi:hypothetical protein
MILLYRFLEICLKLGLIFLILSFERVVGLPVLFLTVVVSLMLIARSFSKYIVFVFAAFMLAIFYEIAFLASLILIAFFYFGFVFGQKVLESNLQRFLGLLLLSNIIIFYVSDANINFWIVLQVIIGLVVSSIFLLKFLFVKYGFLGSKLSAKHSFLK